jgi:hypothetical protein
MTTSVTISVNGDHKVSYVVHRGPNEERGVISGRGLDRPNEVSIPYTNTGDPMIVVVGPEEPDTGVPA